MMEIVLDLLAFGDKLNGKDSVVGGVVIDAVDIALHMLDQPGYTPIEAFIPNDHLPAVDCAAVNRVFG